MSTENDQNFKKIPQETPGDFLLNQSRNFEGEILEKTRRKTQYFGQGRSSEGQNQKTRNQSHSVQNTSRKSTTIFGEPKKDGNFFQKMLEFGENTGNDIINKFNFGENSKFLSEFHCGDNTFEKYIKCQIEKNESILTISLLQENSFEDFSNDKNKEKNINKFININNPLKLGFFTFLDKKDETIWLLQSNFVQTLLENLKENHEKILKIFLEQFLDSEFSSFDVIIKEALNFINSEYLTKRIVKQS